MSLTVRFADWSFSTEFKSIPEFSKAIKQAEKAVNDQLTKQI